MKRRNVKEFRPDEALKLISADREGRALRCPSCGSASVKRSPARMEGDPSAPGRVVIACAACGRSATYIHGDTG